LDGWIKAFRPDLIYSTLEGPHVISLVEDVSRKYGVNVVPHFMDDWIVRILPHGDGILADWVRRRATGQALAVLSSAPARLVIGAAMATEYRERYGCVFEPFMNCVEPTAVSAGSRQVKNGVTFRFAYTGGLHLGRWDVLREIGQVLVSLTSPGTKAVIDVYAPHAPSETASTLLNEAAIRYCGHVQPDQVQQLVADYDGLLHVESFADHVMAYTRLSISTKIPQYLSSGTAIFAYGPRDLASMQYLECNDCGLVVSDQSPGVLGQELRRFIRDRDLRTQLGARARSVAVMYHDAHTVRERFRRVLANAVGRRQKERVACSAAGLAKGPG
jgi:hypothetical protein